ncbi:MAG TPA: hypothetical protein VGQ57_05610, partial [Polyangiaceae bacterium]|nr:hypothetical protein [Polyangiaceae bacterium]
MRRAGWLLAVLALGCAPSVPARWVEGGSPLVLSAARWSRGDADPVEVRPDGKVYEGGDLIFLIDRVGRVTDDRYDPVAVLLPDGRLAGTDETFLGQVGVTNASPPFSGQAWLAVVPNGQVLYFSDEGERASGGVWAGCEGPPHRTCT